MPEQLRLFEDSGFPTCPSCGSMDLAVREEGYRLFEFFDSEDAEGPEVVLMGSHDGVWTSRSLVCQDCRGTWPLDAFVDFPRPADALPLGT